MSLRKSRELTSCCRGGAVIEFALVLPILLLILFGIIEFSVALYDKAVITNASREATRAGILSRNAHLTEAQIRQVALDYCADRLISFGSNNTNPIVSVVKPQAPTTSDPLEVLITFQYTGFGLGRLVANLTGPLELSASTVMAYE
jgi:Flp pilus assembly protein TadG